MDAQLNISTDEHVIGPLCDFTYSWCLNCGLSEHDALRFSIAVSELITDIILFAYPSDSQAFFDIEYKHTLSNIELIVSEVGEPFDPDRHRYDVKDAIENGNFEGAGFRLIRAFCDDFLFVNKGKEGKEFRLTKNIEVRSIDRLLERKTSRDEAELELEDEPDTGQPVETFTITRVKPSDAEDISKLIYRTYGYTYTKEELYFPKKIEKAVLGKEKLGVITRDTEGNAIGYFAVLKKEDSNIAEVGEAVVSPAYRRKGIMGRMMRHLINLAREQKLAALFGKAVTNHPVSQKVNHKYGFKTVALMLAETSNVVFKGFDEEYPQPVSVVIDFLPLNPREEKAVYLPEKYRDIIKKTYQKFDMTVSPREPKKYRLAAKSEIELSMNYPDSTAFIIVNKYGSDFRSVLTEMLKSLEEKETLNVIYLDLPLQNSATPGQFEEIKDLGFIYCGLIPLFHHEDDYLRLQKVNIRLDLDLIEVFSNFGQNLKTLVADEYHRNA